MTNQYKIQNAYTPRLNPAHHDDRSYTEQAQREVYQYCAAFMAAKKLQTVVDVGCGSGFKLITYLGNFETVGIETEPCVSALKMAYPERTWLLSGEPERSFLAAIDNYLPDVVLCCDVIEHIVDPDSLIGYLLSLNASYYIISTPCRFTLCNHAKFAAQYAHTWHGPPLNPCHVREWTMSEFVEYLALSFTVLQSFYGNNQIECQYHLLQKQ